MPTEWEVLTLKPLTAGYNSLVVPSLLKEGASPKIENFFFNKGQLKTDYGYAVKGSAVRGTARIIYQYNKKSGVSEILLVTNTTLYKWNSAEWQYIAGDASTTADGGEPAAETDLVVDDITGFSDGDYIGVILDNGKQHQTTINGAPAGVTIVLTDAVPAGRTIPDAAGVVLACAFSGQNNKPVTVTSYPAYDAAVINTSLDNVKIYDGSTCVDIPNLVTACGGASAYARTIILKDNKLILFGTTESATPYPQRVRWCATGDHTDWSTAGDAGFEDLYNSEDHITAAAHLGPYVIIYRSNTIYRMEFVGVTGLIYNFEQMLPNEGAVSAHGALVRGASHIVMGAENFYLYAGGYELKEFGSEVWESIYGENGNLNATYKQNVFVGYLPSLKKYFFMLPMGSESQPSTVWVYDLKTQSWTTRVFADSILSVTEIQLLEGNAWIDQTTTWEDPIWNISWNDPSLRVGAATILMTGIKGGTSYVFEYSNESTTDDGAAIIGEFQTGELYHPEYKVRVDRVVVLGKGTVTITYSTDEGSTWTAYGTATCGSSFSIQRTDKQLIEDGIMFKFTGSSVELDRIQIYWKPESQN